MGVITIDHKSNKENLNKAVGNREVLQNENFLVTTIWEIKQEWPRPGNLIILCLFSTLCNGDNNGIHIIMLYVDSINNQCLLGIYPI